MQHPHLAPDDIDVLLDGEETLGVSTLPVLRAHVDECEACRAQVEDARAVAELLERLPDVVPSMGFANRVMSRVQVFEPWHVAMLDAVKRLVSVRGPARTLAAAGAGGIGLTLSALAIWAGLRFDQTSYAAQLAIGRAEAAAAATVGSAVSGLFGDAAVATVQNAGMPAVAVGVATLLIAFGAATIGLRGLIGAAKRRGQ